MKASPLIQLSCTFFCFWLFSQPIEAQYYTDAAGLRGGTGATMSYKKFVSSPIAFEAIVGSYDYDYFGLSVLFEKHEETGMNRVQWYWGVGPYLTTARNFSSWGAMGALGIDLSFESIPINLTLDWTPRIRFKSGGRLFLRSAGVGLRYIIQY